MRADRLRGIGLLALLTGANRPTSQTPAFSDIPLRRRVAARMLGVGLPAGQQTAEDDLVQQLNDEFEASLTRRRFTQLLEDYPAARATSNVSRDTFVRHAAEATSDVTRERYIRELDATIKAAERRARVDHALDKISSRSMLLGSTGAMSALVLRFGGGAGTWSLLSATALCGVVVLAGLVSTYFKLGDRWRAELRLADDLQREVSAWRTGIGYYGADVTDEERFQLLVESTQQHLAVARGTLLGEEQRT